MSAIQGHLDSVNAGFIFGWAIKTGSIEKPELFIEVNGKITQKVTANLFRQDLKEHNISDGHCAFQARFDAFDLDTSKSVVIRVLDSNQNPIDGMALTLPNLLNKFKFEVISIAHFRINCRISSTEEIGRKSFNLYANDKSVLRVDHIFTAGTHEFQIPIPAGLINDVEQHITIGVDGSALSLWRGTKIFNSVTTPLEYIKGAAKLPGAIGSCAQAQYRYESLKLTLSNMPSDLNIQDVLTAHDILVEGWHGRKTYPKLTLPKFDKPLVSIIIPAYNKFEITYHTIASIILAPTSVEYEVILADDCSSDETEKAEEYIKNIKVVHNPENLMFLRSCNNASKSARGKYLLFLNNDTEVTANWLDELIEPMESDESVALTGSKLLNEDGSLQEAGGIVWNNGKPWNVGYGLSPKLPEFNYRREVDYLSGAALCIKASIWREIGGFSEYLAPAYFEDTDIAFKVRAAGYKTVYTPQSEVFHFEGMSHGKDVTKGVKKFQVVNATKFASKWADAFKYSGKEGVELNLQKDRNVDKRIMLFDHSTPTPSEDAGSYAAIQEIRVLQGLGFKVTFVPQNIAHLGQLTVEMQKMGVEVLYAPFYNTFESIIEQRLPEMDAVYITRYSVAEIILPIIKRFNREIPILFNNADLHFLREMRAALNDNDDEALEKALETKEKELAVMKEVDAILSYNETEHAVITSHILQQDKVHKCPWVLHEKPQGKPFKERSGIAFLGGFRHTPNAEAVDYFVKYVSPLLKQANPEIVLHVYGSHMPEHYRDLEVDNINFVGFAESLDDVFNHHRIFVAPLLSGAGIKGKVLEAMAYNIPCVLTDVAAEGTGLSNNISALIANNPEQWVEKICKLYDDNKLWENLRSNAKILVENNFTYEGACEQMKKVFASVGIFL